MEQVRGPAAITMRVHTGDQAIDSSPSRWTFTLTIELATLAILATSERREHAIKTWRTLGCKS